MFSRSLSRSSPVRVRLWEEALQRGRSGVLQRAEAAQFSLLQRPTRPRRYFIFFLKKCKQLSELLTKKDIQSIPSLNILPISISAVAEHSFLLSLGFQTIDKII